LTGAEGTAQYSVVNWINQLMLGPSRFARRHGQRAPQRLPGHILPGASFSNSASSWADARSFWAYFKSPISGYR
jgi:hypothetical protein